MNDNKKFWRRFAKRYSPLMEKGNGKLYDDMGSTTAPLLYLAAIKGNGRISK